MQTNYYVTTCTVQHSTLTSTDSSEGLQYQPLVLEATGGSLQDVEKDVLEKHLRGVLGKDTVHCM